MLPLAVSMMPFAAIPVPDLVALSLPRPACQNYVVISSKRGTTQLRIGATHSSGKPDCGQHQNAKPGMCATPWDDLSTMYSPATAKTCAQTVFE